LWQLLEGRLKRDDPSHDPAHVLRVYTWSLKLCAEAGAEPELAGAAALLHDLIITPKDGPERSDAATLSAEASVPSLQLVGFNEAEQQRVLEAIATASWSAGKPPRNAEGMVLQDADRLDAIGAIGIARCFACGASMHSRAWMQGEQREGGMWHPVDPWAQSGRSADDRRWALDHFERKLLRLPEGMHTTSARQEAQRRLATMQNFLAALRAELV
jgi:uncharacterized protein